MDSLCPPIVLLIGLGLMPSAVSAQAASPDRLKNFAPEIAREMRTWQVPGVALAVVRGEQVIWAKGYGYRDVARKLPVNSKTLFPIGSSTKSMTVAALAVLARQGKLDWDHPVREYLPDFRLYDDVATAHLTPRDLVTHRSGLPRHDYVWYNAPLNRSDLYSRLRYLEPSHELRSTWQYQNLMFLTAGYLTEKLTGTPWEESVRSLLLAPLEMGRSNFAVSELQKSDDYALPYQKDERDNVRLIPFRTIDAMGPAGSVNSSADDMAHYLVLQLNNGRYHGVQLVDPADIDAMQSPQMVVPAPLEYPELGHTQYGMGFFITTYRGHKLVHHGGNIDGFSAMVALMPQDSLGVVVLSNLDGSHLPTVLSYGIFDCMLGLPPVEWTARFKGEIAKEKAQEESAKKQELTPRKRGTRPAHTLEEYAGEYEHPAYGRVAIRLEGENLSIEFHGFKSPLRHYHYEVFDTPPDKLNPLEKNKVVFLTDINGDVSGLSIPLEPEVHDIVWGRVADRAMFARSFLEPFTGEYETPGLPAQVTLRGDSILVLALPGEPTHELEPLRGTTFRLKGLSGYSVEFRKNGVGKVGEMAVYRPDGNAVLKRKS